jgi:hypothetical protein
MDTTNNIIHGDPNRVMEVRLENSTLRGSITGGAVVRLDSKSQWGATADSDVTLMGTVNASQIDAPAGVTITAKAGQAGEVTLASGGKLVLIAE